MSEFDVVIVGAGLAGASAAAILGRQPLRVAIVDPRETYPPAFKAEKIEPDQAALFRELEMMEGLLSVATSIRTIDEAHAGRVLNRRTIEQYGVSYEVMVNAVRDQIPSEVERLVGRVSEVRGPGQYQEVRLDSGQAVRARLVVVATGTSPRLPKTLGFSRRVIRNEHSLCSGFDVRAQTGSGFDFDSLTYWGDRLAEGIDYVTFFPIRDRMRVNLFAYRRPSEEWVRQLARDPFGTLRSSAPRMERVTGKWAPSGKVENYSIDLYVTEAPARDGVILIGDAFQSVCPATGTGLSKVLTDVLRACHTYIPRWLNGPAVTAANTAEYYADAVKTAVDADSLASAEHRRRFGTDRSLRWWVHRRKTFAQIALTGLRQRFGMVPVSD